MTRVILTYADYAALPDDGRQYELHEGELSVTPSPGTRHQRLNANLFDVLRHHVRDHQLGELLDAPTDCILSDITVVQPDVLFIDTEHASLVSERAIEGARPSPSRCFHPPPCTSIAGAKRSSMLPTA